jgi:hypothetical protein
MVYDLKRKKWFQIDRGTGKYLQVGIPVKDTYGNSYCYGCIDTGYMERLEYGTTMDTSSITFTVKTGDIPIGNWTHESQVRHVKVISKAKSDGTATLTHYGNSLITATDATVSHSLIDATHRVAIKKGSVLWGPNSFHSFKLTLTSSTQSIAFEPIGLAVLYKVIREDLI